MKYKYTLFTLSAKAKMRLVKGLIEQGDVKSKPQTITLDTMTHACDCMYSVDEFTFSPRIHST